MRKMFIAGLCLASSLAMADADSNGWLVEEGELRLTEQQFEQMIQYNVPEHEQQSWRYDRSKFNNLVTEYFMLQQLKQEALAMGIDQEPAFRSKMEMLELRALSAEAQQRLLAAQAEPDFEQAAREAFLVNRDSFRSQDEVHARHILVAFNDQRDADQALARAQEVREKWLAAPDSFTELVSEYSDDPGAASNQGDLGFFAANRMVKPFAEAAFALQPGEVSEPVRSEFGYHVIQQLDRRDGRLLEFADVKDQLIRQERSTFKKRQREDLQQQIQLREAVEYNLPAIDAFYERLIAE